MRGQHDDELHHLLTCVASPQVKIRRDIEDLRFDGEAARPLAKDASRLGIVFLVTLSHSIEATINWSSIITLLLGGNSRVK